MSTFDPEAYANRVAADLALFADIGTDLPSIEPVAGGYTIRLTRKGDVSEIAISRRSEALIEQWAEASVKYANLRSLLASDRYANLRDWATKQAAFSSQEMKEVGDLIDVRGHLNDPFNLIDVSGVDDALCAKQQPESTRVLLIDGPAGIGKTQFIMSIAARRAEGYVRERRPLVLSCSEQRKNFILSL